jgi:hypothetical protein
MQQNDHAQKLPQKIRTLYPFSTSFLSSFSPAISRGSEVDSANIIVQNEIQIHKQETFRILQKQLERAQTENLRHFV